MSVILLSQIVTIIATVVTVSLGFRLFLVIQRRRYRHNQKQVLLSIKVSRENEKLPIVAEQMFAALHGILHKISFWDQLRGVAQETFSFEIANVDEQIKFYAYVPAHLRNFLEGQIYAQYPDVEIEEVADYSLEPPVNIRQPSNSDAGQSGKEIKNEKAIAETEVGVAQPMPFQSVHYFQHALGAEIVYTDPPIYPIKRYPQFEDKITRTAVDPISAITSVLAKLPNPTDRAMVQIAVLPLDAEQWRIKATKCARIIGKNIFFGIEYLQKAYVWAFMTRKIWPRVVFFPIYFLFWLQGLMAGSKVSFSQSASDRGGGEDVLEETASLKHDKETASDAVMDKVVRLSFDVSIRVVYVPSVPDIAIARTKVRELAGAFKQFNMPHLNGFRIGEVGGKEILRRYHEREVSDSNPMVLNIEELATIFHLPNVEVKTPNIYWVTSKKLEPPVDLPDSRKEHKLTTLGQANYRGSEKLFGIRTEDRRRHIYIIGKTGMGKSTLLENMIISDICAGKGVAVVDPHGDLADHILDQIPSNRTNDVVIFDPSDREYPVAFNMLENIDPAMSSMVASGLVGIFKKLYAESWGPRLEHILRNTILSLLEYPNTTMLGIPRMLVDEDFRKRIVRKITDPIVKRFWADEFEKMQERQRTEAISPIQNKVGQFLSSSIIRNIVGQPKSMIDLRYVMDNKKIFICNLSKGKIGEDNSSLLGSMIITKFQLDAMSRSNIPEKDRVDFYLYVDEFQNFATDSFATILSEARKYRLNLTMANQYIAQMSDEVRDAVFGNVGTLMSFQVGFDDAEYISKQFSEIVLPNDLVQLPKYNLYNKLLIDGMPAQPFSATTLAPVGEEIGPERREKVIRLSRERYARKRAIVEDKIRRWSAGSDEAEAKEAKIDQPKVKSSSVKKPNVVQAPVKSGQIPKKKISTPKEDAEFFKKMVTPPSVSSSRSDTAVKEFSKQKTADKPAEVKTVPPQKPATDSAGQQKSVAHSYAELVAHYTQYYQEHHKLSPAEAKKLAEKAAADLAPPKSASVTVPKPMVASPIEKTVRPSVRSSQKPVQSYEQLVDYYTRYYQQNHSLSFDQAKQHAEKAAKDVLAKQGGVSESAQPATTAPVVDLASVRVKPTDPAIQKPVAKADDPEAGVRVKPVAQQETPQSAASKPVHSVFSRSTDAQKTAGKVQSPVGKSTPAQSKKTYPPRTPQSGLAGKSRPQPNSYVKKSAFQSGSRQSAKFQLPKIKPVPKNPPVNTLKKYPPKANPGEAKKIPAGK